MTLYPNATPEDRALFKLQDRIESGDLTRDEIKTLSRLVAAVGASDDTIRKYGERACWDGARNRYNDLLAVTREHTAASTGGVR